VSSDGPGSLALTDGTKDSAPTWSPDGKYIAFIRDRQLHVMNSDGSNLRRIEIPLDIVIYPAWRP
jgi:Tol biopolymer transport system component